MKVLVVVRADELLVGDVLSVIKSRIESAAVGEVFSTGHGRVQVTTSAGKLWFDSEQLVVVSRRAL